MDQELSFSEELSKFVLAYYRSVTYKIETETKKYYSPNARIWRQNMNIEGEPLSQHTEVSIFFPILEKEDKLAIISFHGLSLPHGFNLFVEGIICIKNVFQKFEQIFTIYEIQKRYFIYSDNLSLSPIPQKDKQNFDEILKNLKLQVPFKSTHY